MELHLNPGKSLRQYEHASLLHEQNRLHEALAAATSRLLEMETQHEAAAAPNKIRTIVRWYDYSNDSDFDNPWCESWMHPAKRYDVTTSSLELARIATFAVAPDIRSTIRSSISLGGVYDAAGSLQSTHRDLYDMFDQCEDTTDNLIETIKTKTRNESPYKDLPDCAKTATLFDALVRAEILRSCKETDLGFSITEVGSRKND